MHESDWDAVLDAAVGAARPYLASLPERRVYRPVEPDELRQVLSAPLTDAGEPAADVVAGLARDLDPFVTAHASGRFFGFVIGGLHPAATAPSCWSSTWDQNAGLYAPTPGVAVVEEVAAGWIVELLGLPEGSSVGFVTGGQMANFTCLAAARDDVLRASRVGRRGGRPAGRAARRRRRQDRPALDHPPGAALPRSRRADRDRGRLRRPGPLLPRRRCRRPSRRSTGRRSSAPRPAT